jgi:aqualysin 1
MAPLLGDATGAIPDEYIVVFRDGIGASGLDSAMNRISLRDVQSRVMRQYEIVPGFAARLSARDLAAIRGNPDVKYVERNGLVRAAKIENVQAQGIDRIDQRDLPRDGLYDDRGFDGTGVRVYIIDTGIRPTHTEFAGRVDGLHDVTGGNGIDCNGHGTHVTSTVAGAQRGVADRARIHSVKVLNCQGAGSFAGVIAGINLVAQQCATGTPCAVNMGLEGGLMLFNGVNGPPADTCRARCGIFDATKPCQCGTTWLQPGSTIRDCGRSPATACRSRAASSCWA